MKTVVAKVDFQGYTSPNAKAKAFAKGETYSIPAAVADAWAEQGIVTIGEADTAAEDDSPAATTRRGEKRGSQRGTKD